MSYTSGMENLPSIRIKLPQEMRDAIDRVIARRGQTMSFWVRSAINAALVGEGEYLQRPHPGPVGRHVKDKELPAVGVAMRDNDAILDEMAKLLTGE